MGRRQIDGDITLLLVLEVSVKNLINEFAADKWEPLTEDMADFAVVEEGRGGVRHLRYFVVFPYIHSVLGRSRALGR